MCSGRVKKAGLWIGFIGRWLRKSWDNFTLLSHVQGSFSSLLLSRVGCWKTEILVPWKEVLADVAVRLLSITYPLMMWWLNHPLCNTGGHPTLSSLCWLTTASPSCTETSSIPSSEMMMLCLWSISTNCVFLVLAKTEIPVQTGSLGIESQGLWSVPVRFVAEFGHLNFPPSAILPARSKGWRLVCHMSTSSSFN